jgi:hypothetical protein
MPAHKSAISVFKIVNPIKEEDIRSCCKPPPCWYLV